MVIVIIEKVNTMIGMSRSSRQSTRAKWVTIIEAVRSANGRCAHQDGEHGNMDVTIIEALKP
jgi:hypothetical protein